MTLAKRYRRLYAGVLYDALAFDLKLRAPFVLSTALRPIDPRPGQAIAGPAFTCHGRHVQSVAEAESLDSRRLDMLADAEPGAIQVLATASCPFLPALYGDVTAALSQRAGLAGAIVAGPVRDVARIRQVGFPLWHVGTSPVDAFGRWAITEWQTEVWFPSCGTSRGVYISPGDWVFADESGVMAIPSDRVEEACGCAEARLEREAAIRADIMNGKTATEIKQGHGRW